MRIQIIDVKNLLTKSKLPDADFVINPYVGCCHGCIYCYAEFVTRFTGHAGERWGEFMDVKECRTPLSLKTLKKVTCNTVLIGSVTDPYNPLENHYKKTRRLLMQLKDADARVEILTKSPLVTRDIDLLSQMKDVHVGISLSTMNKGFAEMTERHAASPRRRLETMHVLSEAGVPVYAFVSPIFPFFSDWRRVADEASKVAEMVCFENLNLRGGYKRAVLGTIAQYCPERAKAFAAIYHDKTAFRQFWQEMEAEIRAYMSGRPHKIYFFHEDIKKA